MRYSQILQLMVLKASDTTAWKYLYKKCNRPLNGKIPENHKYSLTIKK